MSRLPRVRRGAFPFLACLLLLATFVIDGSRLTSTGPVVTGPVALASYAVVAVVGGVLVAAAATRTANGTPDGWLRAVFDPRPGTLLVVGGTVGGLVAFLGLTVSDAVTLPAWSDTPFQLAGLVAGLPTILTQVILLVGGDVVGVAVAGLPLQLALVLSVPATTAWLFLLADAVRRLALAVVGTVRPTRRE